MKGVPDSNGGTRYLDQACLRPHTVGLREHHDGLGATATSLITFGFSVYKFFQFDIKRDSEFSGLVGPREFGMMMITFGLVSLAAGTVQHITSMRQLRAQNQGMPRSIAALLAFLISFLGIFPLIAVLFRQ